MNKTFKIYAVIFIIILIVMGMFEMNKKPVLDWRKNFNTEKKTPFGLYIFDQESNGLFHQKLEKGYNDIAAGRVQNATEAFAKFRENH